MFLFKQKAALFREERSASVQLMLLEAGASYWLRAWRNRFLVVVCQTHAQSNAAVNRSVVDF